MDQHSVFPKAYYDPGFQLHDFRLREGSALMQQQQQILQRNAGIRISPPGQPKDIQKMLFLNPYH